MKTKKNYEKKTWLCPTKGNTGPPLDDFFYHLEEHPLGVNFSNFKKKLHIGTFFIDPQSLEFFLIKNFKKS